jgi:hypothetical protein
MSAPDGTVVGKLASGDGAHTLALVQGQPVALAPGVSVIPGWSDRADVELVCKVAAGAYVAVNGRRRTGMFVIGPGQTFSLRDGDAGETTWTLVCAEQVPVAVARAGGCAFCHRALGGTGIRVDATGLPPRWRALVDGPLCPACATVIAEARRPTREKLQ